MDQLEHSPLGGSGAKRFLNCDGSFLLHRKEIEAGTFENITTEYAQRGNAAHLLGSTCLSSGREPYEYIGVEFEGLIAGWPDGIELDPVSVYVTHCQRIMDQNPDGRTMIEQTIHLPHLHPLLKGTVDFGHWVFDNFTAKAWLVDYKNGEGVGVYVLDNEQLLYYSFLLIMHVTELMEAPDDAVMTLAIVQPNFFGIFEAPEVWEQTFGNIRKWGNGTLLPRMWELYNRDVNSVTDADFHDGDWCQFCPVLLDCPKMQTAFEDFVEGEEDFIMMLTNAELDAYYAKRASARRFMNALDNVVHARLTTSAKPEEFKHAKLVEKKVNRVWRPGADAVLVEAFKDKAYNPAKIKSPAQIEKLSTRGKELALEYGYKPESFGLSVAPMDDPRPAAQRKGNSHVFAAFETGTEEQGW